MNIKNGNSIIRIEKKKWKDKEYTDIRKYYQDKETGEWKHTKKGIMIPIDLMKQVTEELQKIQK